jgi:dienelactone hydrolase
MGNGYDGAQEELLHVCVAAALDRGYHVITYEGPGQPTVRRSQNLAFMPEWEKVVTPVVDYLFQQPHFNTSKIALFGYSMGGFLSVRAAAREPRITAVIAIDGVYSLFSSFLKTLPAPLISWFNDGKKAELDAAITGMLTSASASTNARWGVSQGLWSFNPTSCYDLLVASKAFTLDGFVQDVKCKVFVGDAENDHFFDGQPELMAKALGDKATYFMFKNEDGAGEHCHIGAAVRMNAIMFDWLIKVWGA